MSVDTPETSRRLRNKLGAGYTFLSDVEGKVLDLFQIRHDVPSPAGRDIAVPTSILVDRSGVIRWIFQPQDYRVRARPWEILNVLDSLEMIP